MVDRAFSPDTTSRPPAVVLSIAGSDNTAGAGIQADIKTGAAFGVHVATAITAVTAQGDVPQPMIHAMPAQVLAAQLDSVYATFNISAIKLGMLATRELMEVVADFLSRCDQPVVVDPVLGATAGGSLYAGEPSDYFERIIPKAAVITPNLLEAAALLNEPQAKTEEDILRQGEMLSNLGAKAVLIKGGHSQLRLATDYLFVGGETLPFSAPWQSRQHTHGTGCTLAAAIAAGLAQGLTLQQAIAAAKSYVQGALQHAQRLHLVKNNGPVHHFYQYW